MIRRSRKKYKYISITLLIAVMVVFNEFVVYYLKSFDWSFKKCSSCVKVLIVADPQILGHVHENYFGSSVAIWDNDRYLYKTFRYAVRYSQPDVIIFLGDLMDEGHISDFQSFEKYKFRFDSIFDTPDHIMKIYLPGDNDIGGEEDFVNNKIHERFKFSYTQPDVLIKNNVIFFKVNKMTHFIPYVAKYGLINEYVESNKTHVVLSHMPLLFKPDKFAFNVTKELRPQIIFTAHEHKAMYISEDTTLEQFSEIRRIPVTKTPLYQMNLYEGDIYEFLIPTCSYRMGVRDMGYGLAYIDTRTKTLDFTILWLPDRFFILWTYVYGVGVIVSVYIILSLCNCVRYENSYTLLPTKQ